MLQYALYRTVASRNDTIPHMKDEKARGERLRAIRKKAGYSSAEKFAETHGFSAATVRSAENGNRPLTVRNAKLFATQLGVTWQWLYFGDDKHPEAEYAEAVEYLKTLHPRRRAAILQMLRTEAELAQEDQQHIPESR